MKTLLFTLEYPPFLGGVANYYGNLAKYWPEPNNIIVLDNADDKLISRKWPMLKWLPSVWQLYKNVKKNKIDHILVGQLLPLGTSAWLVSKITGVRYSVIMHGMDFAYAVKNRRKKKMAYLILKDSQAIICGNSYLSELVKNTFGEALSQKITVVNPGVETSRVFGVKDQVLGLKKKFNLENKLVLLSIGRLVKRKGFDKVIESLPEVLEKNPNLAYVILGNGEELENLKLGIRDLNLQNKVVFITDANSDDKWAWYDVCDVFIMPARNINGDFEGFGIVYLEANSCGKPVIAGDAGGVRDAVVDGMNGLLADPEDASDIAKTIIKLASDKELRLKLGERGRERALKDFQWQDKIKEIYQTIKI